MKLRTDPDSFLAMQEVFTGEMIACIADRLEEVGIEGTQLKELTGKIAFDIACMVDDTAGLEFNGVEAHPYLAFALGNDEIIHFGGGSTAHELVYGILNAMFNEST
ncbi:MAG: hypothetical protein ABW077_19325 [Candidatus Thiodiazotropha endolucinida]